MWTYPSSETIVGALLPGLAATVADLWIDMPISRKTRPDDSAAGE